MKNIFFGLIVLLLLACSSHEPAGTPAPFAKSIAAFKKQDSISFPPENAILFIGSSSFTLWDDVQNYFPGYTIINRGFGGSTLEDQIRYANAIIFPYKPKQIVIYCGENDLAFSDTVTSIMVFERFKKLFQMIRGHFADLPVVYISMKPSPSRRHLFSKMREGNQMILDFLKNMSKTVFIDVHSKMLNEQGEPFPEIFLDDSLHMNSKGYSIWQKEIQPHLLKD